MYVSAMNERGGAAQPDVPSEAILLARLRASDGDALAQLLDRHWPALHRYALRRTGSPDTAADVAQDAFCRLWERRETWRADGSVRGLLFRLARNAAVTRHRQMRARRRAHDAFAELSLDRAAPVAAEHAELRAALAAAVADLPARRREVFLLRMVDDLSYAEIAATMGTSKQTVANQLTRALATLRLTLSDLLD